LSIVNDRLPLRMWLYDIAREQSPTYDVMRRMCDVTLEAGYNAIGLYLEHRFAYPHAPWARGTGALTGETIQKLQDAYGDLQIVPFINLLGHFEGFLYTEPGSHFAEERFHGMQADPTNAAFEEFARAMLDDTIATFRSDIIHIGGDETMQLGANARSREAVLNYERSSTLSETDGKALLYGNHFGPLSRYVTEAGRRPAMWGDVLLDHPQAIELIPRQTLIFDWQYFGDPARTAARFLEVGFEVVLCPALHTYNAPWMHLPQSEENVRQHARAASRVGATGICVTTWECALFGHYETLIPAIRASGSLIAGRPPDEGTAPTVTPRIEPSSSGGQPLKILPADERARYAPLRDSPAFLEAYRDCSPAYAAWAELMGSTIQDAGGTFAFSGRRSPLKSRLLLFSNPFLLWLRNRDELLGVTGERALAVAEEALAIAPDDATRGVSELVRIAIAFVRSAEEAHQAYASGRVDDAIASLAGTCELFIRLEGVALATHEAIGGSLADIERCRIARDHVSLVIDRLRRYGQGQLGYLPSFETLTHPKFVPHDQANWWLINRWGNE
jgi:hypothetical protein